MQRIKFLNVIYIPVLVLSMIAAVIYINKPQIFKSRAGSFTEIKCDVSSYLALKGCFSSMQKGEINVINITKSIVCNEKQPCDFQLSNITNGKITSPYGDRSVGFVRDGKYDSPVFQISNSNNITVSNLFIDDNKNQAWCAYPDPNCRPQIVLTGSQEITFDNLFLLNSKAQSIAMEGSKNVYYKNSLLTNSFLQGIWMKAVDGVKISNSTFRDTHAAALFLRGDNIEISNNILQHNQYKPPWIIQGGQLNITGANHVRINGNTIEKGSYEGHVTPGIEIDGTQTNTDVIISNNTIRNNTGWGIVRGKSEGKTVVFTGIIIENNTLTSNLKPMIIDLEGINNWTVKNNICDGSQCPVFPGSVIPTISIDQVGINKNFNPWALWITGSGLSDNTIIRIYYNNIQWGADLRLNYNEQLNFGSVVLSGNLGPESCNKTAPCLMNVTVFSGSLSASKTFSLPRY